MTTLLHRTGARPPRARSLFAPIVALLLAITLAGCGSSESDATDDSPAAAEPRTLTVLAAASLKGAFTEIGAAFEKANPGVSVAFNFGGSSDLAEQINAGAPADVFASADTKNLEKVGDAAVDSSLFASNTLQIATPPDNPAKIATLKDLAKPGVKLVVCAPEVPCGSAAEKVEQAAGLTFAPVSEEQSVTDVLGKVTAGEADAGLVYVTDVKAAGDAVEGIAFPEASAAVNEYPISALSEAEDAELAQAFVAFVLSDSGQKILANAGFGTA